MDHSEHSPIEPSPKPQVLSGHVPHLVAEAVRAEAMTKDRSVSWVVCRILTEWYRQRPGAQVELELVAPEPPQRRVGL